MGLVENCRYLSTQSCFVRTRYRVKKDVTVDTYFIKTGEDAAFFSCGAHGFSESYGFFRFFSPFHLHRTVRWFSIEKIDGPSYFLSSRPSRRTWFFFFWLFGLSCTMRACNSPGRAIPRALRFDADRKKSGFIIRRENDEVIRDLCTHDSSNVFDIELHAIQRP
jgi:hypothetical protein